MTTEDHGKTIERIGRHIGYSLAALEAASRFLVATQTVPMEAYFSTSVRKCLRSFGVTDWAALLAGPDIAVCTAQSATSRRSLYNQVIRAVRSVSIDGSYGRQAAVLNLPLLWRIQDHPMGYLQYKSFAAFERSLVEFNRMKALRS